MSRPCHCIADDIALGEITHYMLYWIPGPETKSFVIRRFGMRLRLRLAIGLT